jgi:multiple sugar transport system substrate-binding protein
MNPLHRRSFVRLAGAALAAPWLLGGAGRAALAQATLRLFWWGNPERDKRTFEVLELFQQQGGGAVNGEAIGWPDYWPKMATQAAGQNMADVVQMDYRYLFEYARRQQLEPLDGYLGGAIDVSGFEPAFVDSGRVDGQLYAMPMGGNSLACYVDSVKLAEYGIPMPDHSWTWADFAAIAREIKKAAGDGYWGVADKGLWEPALELFLRQRGKALYTADGQLGFEEADVADFFGFWDGLRQEGLVPSPDITAQDIGGLDNTPIVTGNAMIDFAHSNQLVALQALVPNELAMTMLPNDLSGQPGQYHKPAMQLSLAAGGQNKEAAAKLLGFFVNDLGAAEILGVERGVPGDAKVREHIIGKVDKLDRMMIDYLAVVTENVSPLPPPPAKGAGEIETMQRRLYPELAFGRMTVQEAAAQYMQEAQAVLARG